MGRCSDELLESLGTGKKITIDMHESLKENSTTLKAIHTDLNKGHEKIIDLIETRYGIFGLMMIILSALIGGIFVSSVITNFSISMDVKSLLPLIVVFIFGAILSIIYYFKNLKK